MTPHKKHYNYFTMHYISTQKAQGFNCHSIKPLAWTIICGNIVHNFSDGLTLEAAISQSLSLGVSAAIAIAFHEIPHELGELQVIN